MGRQATLFAAALALARRLRAIFTPYFADLLAPALAHLGSGEADTAAPDGDAAGGALPRKKRRRKAAAAAAAAGGEAHVVVDLWLLRLRVRSDRLMCLSLVGWPTFSN